MISFLSAMVETSRRMTDGITDAPDAVKHSVFVGHLGVCRTGVVVKELLDCTGRDRSRA